MRVKAAIPLRAGWLHRLKCASFASLANHQEGREARILPKLGFDLGEQASFLCNLVINFDGKYTVKAL